MALWKLTTVLVAVEHMGIALEADVNLALLPILLVEQERNFC